jgi:hypothetical protein
MKKLIILVFVPFVLVACGGKQVKNSTASTGDKQATTNTASAAKPGCACTTDKCYYPASDPSFKWCRVVGGWKGSQCKKSPWYKHDPRAESGMIKSSDNTQAWVNLDFSGLDKKSFNKKDCEKY